MYKKILVIGFLILLLGTGLASTVSADHWYSHWSRHHHWNGDRVCHYTRHTWHDWYGKYHWRWHRYCWWE
jgi:hypothetical protein